MGYEIRDQRDQGLRGSRTKGIRDQGDKGPRGSGTKDQGDQGTRGSGNQGIRDPGDQGPRGSGNKGIREPGGQVPRGSGTQGIRDPWDQGPRGSGTNRIRDLGESGTKEIIRDQGDQLFAADTRNITSTKINNHPRKKIYLGAGTGLATAALTARLGTLLVLLTFSGPPRDNSPLQYCHPA